jgi:hypothetical protein
MDEREMLFASIHKKSKENTPLKKPHLPFNGRERKSTEMCENI